jgi:hypothetical protein
MGFAFISIFVLSNMSGLAVITSTAVIIDRTTSGSSPCVAARLCFL